MFTLSSLQTNSDIIPNSTDPDKTAHNEPSHQDLQSLQLCYWLLTEPLFAIMDVSTFRVHFRNLGLKRLKPTTNHSNLDTVLNLWVFLLFYQTTEEPTQQRPTSPTGPFCHSSFCHFKYLATRKIKLKQKIQITNCQTNVNTNVQLHLKNNWKMSSNTYEYKNCPKMHRNSSVFHTSISWLPYCLSIIE